jgi:hypothetical protein
MSQEFMRPSGSENVEGPEDLVVLDDLILDPLSPEEEAKGREELAAAVAAHEQAKIYGNLDDARKNLAEAARLVRPLMDAASLMAKNTAESKSA